MMRPEWRKQGKTDAKAEGLSAVRFLGLGQGDSARHPEGDEPGDAKRGLHRNQLRTNALTSRAVPATHTCRARAH